MRIKISFKKCGELPIQNIDGIVSYVHRCLGKNNEYHDSFSEYSVSSIQGGKLNKKSGNLEFNEEPYIYVSSLDTEFINKFVDGASDADNKLFGMDLSDISPADFYINDFCDTIITISPILLKNGKNKITINDDVHKWIDCLQEQCIKKLNYAHISTKEFKIEARLPERFKKKMIYVHNVFNPCSVVSLKVYGSKKAREYLYNVGLGNCCGCGFGSVKIYN